MKKIIKDYLDNDAKFDKKTWIGIFSIFIVFAGVFGWCYEFIFYYFNSGCKQFYMRGGNFLPFINIYAWGCIMIFFLTYKLRKKPWLVFLITIVSTGILELVAGYFMYKLTGMRCWDYNIEILNFGNIGGYVCLRSVLVFGFSALLFMYIVLPLIFYIAEHANKKVFLIISISICAIFICDELYNLIFARIFDLPKAPDIYKNLGIPYMNYYYK